MGCSDNDRSTEALGDPFPDGERGARFFCALAVGMLDAVAEHRQGRRREENSYAAVAADAGADGYIGGQLGAGEGVGAMRGMETDVSWGERMSEGLAGAVEWGDVVRM